MNALRNLWCPHFNLDNLKKWNEGTVIWYDRMFVEQWLLIGMEAAFL